MIEYDLRQLIFLSKLQVSAKDYKRNADNYPDKPYTPEDVLEALEKVEKFKADQERQERADAAAAVFSHQEEMKKNLSAPRVLVEDEFEDAPIED